MIPIKMTPIASSQLQAAGYDAATKRLRVQFHPNKSNPTGAFYDYLDVPSETYDALKSAASKGSFFINQIKPRFRYEKIVDEPTDGVAKGEGSSAAA